MLSPDVLKHVRQVQLRTRRLVDGVFAGEYHSVFKGRGMEFAEVREYTPGDDVRTIDWNVTARMGHPFIKKYIEERELTVMLLVDRSASASFGSTSYLKDQIVTDLCAVLAMSAIKNNDKVGLILFTDRIEKFVPPQKGRNRALRVIRDLLYATPESRGTDIGLALEYLHKICHRRSVAFLVSDFLASGYETALRIAHQKHDVIPICISDRREMSLPAVGLLRVRDLETGATVVVDTDDASTRHDFARRAEARQTERRKLFGTLGMDSVEVMTHEPHFRALMQFFRIRERRLAQGR